MQQETAQPKNKRLSMGDRETLLALAKRKVNETQDSSAVDAAYDAAAVVIARLMAKKFPPQDMAVLARYDAAKIDRCVYYSGGDADYQKFDFRADDLRAPLRPRVSGCNGRTPFLLAKGDESVLTDLSKAKKAFEAEIKQRIADFTALIWGAKTFNEVATVWPGAEALRSTIVGTETSLQVLSADVIDRLKSDQALAA